MRILGIDYGDRRVGVAISDPLGMIAQSFGHIRNDCHLIDHMEGIIRQFDAGLVVVGMPYNLKGDVGMKATEVERFIQALQKQIDIEIRTWDERFTSTIARQTMIQMGMKKSQRQKKGRVDEIAASLILQSYLDAQGR